MEQAGQPVHKRIIENGARSQFDRTHTSYAVNTPAPEGAEEQAAAAGANPVLVTLLPNQTQLLDRQRILYSTKSG